MGGKRCVFRGRARCGGIRWERPAARQIEKQSVRRRAMNNGRRNGAHLWRLQWFFQRGRAAIAARPWAVTLMTKEHVAKSCWALALRRVGGRRSSGIRDARKSNKQGSSDQGGNSAFHGDTPQLGVSFAITTRSTAEEYRRSIKAETAKSPRDSILKCNNRHEKWRLRVATPSWTAISDQVHLSFNSFFAIINFFLRELS